MGTLSSADLGSDATEADDAACRAGSEASLAQSLQIFDLPIARGQGLTITRLHAAQAVDWESASHSAGG